MKITLSYGGGGEETNRLINELFYKYFENEVLLKVEGTACTPTNPLGSCMIREEGLVMCVIGMIGKNQRDDSILS